jgi:hypothetical protein
MVRTQIQLTRTQAQTLKKLAVQRGVSMAELIRQAIDSFFQEGGEPVRAKQEKWERALSVVGAFRSDVSDISSNHDEYFAQAIEDYPRRVVRVEKETATR